MRNIGSGWRNLAEGLLRIETLEARFREEWGPCHSEVYFKG